MDVISYSKAKKAQNRADEVQRGFQKGRLVQNFLDASNWNLQGGLEQTVDPGTGKLKLTSDGTPTFSRKNVNFNLAGFKVLGLSVYIENIKTFSKMTVYLANDIGYANFLSYVINAGECVGGWNKFYIDTSCFSVTGSGSLTNDIVSMQIRIEATATNTSVIWDEFSRDETQQPQLIFTSDDGWGLVNHTYNHVNLSTVDANTADSEITQGEE
ncbi:hypothetical protein [Priestia endophytica]|uniref:hypothetical protein n=1 Tax=Priestia endophytica TaxID=135735 RepID=UPI00227EC675|nr:hypothetical protein [Priestia endophytica]MCY8234828.1 hypothetical protein [Priestia endophytica]